MDFTRGKLARTLAVIALFLMLSHPVRAAGLSDVTSPIQTFVAILESALSNVLALIVPHHTVTVQVAPATWHATGTSATAAAFNAVATTSPAAQPQPLADAATTITQPPPLPSPPAAPHPAPQPTSPLTSVSPAINTNYITQDELTAQIQQATNALRTLIYQGESAPNSLPASGGYTNEIAVSNAIDQLSGTTITNPTISGGSITNVSLTPSEIPDLSGSYLSLNGGTVSGDLNVGGNFTAGSISFGAASSSNSITTNATTTNFFATTASSTNLFSSFANFGVAVANSITASISNFAGLVATNATSTNLYAVSAVIPSLIATNATTSALVVTGTGYFAGNVGIGTTSPPVPLTIDSSSANGTIFRLSNASTGGHIFDLLSTGSANTGGAGRLDIFDRTANLARLSIAANGNVGVGTTSPFTNLAVNGSGYFGGNLTAANFVTGGTIAATGNGTSILGGNLNIEDQIFFDNFNRPNQSGLGTAPNGQTYLTTGAGVGTVEISNDTYTGSGVIYAGVIATTTPTRIGGTFSFSATTSAAFALISSSDGSIALQHLLHLVIGSGGLTLSWWINSSQDNIIACTGPGFPSTLQQNGTVYSVYETISTSTNTVHITDPFGQSLDCYDPHISQVAGNLTIWEITDAGYDQNWHSTEQDALTTQSNVGTVAALGGFQGPVGNITPSALFANSLSIGTSTTANPLEIENDIGNKDGIQVYSTGGGATLRLKAPTAGYQPVIYFDQGETNVPYIYSSGNANDLRLNVGGTDRIVFPVGGRVGVGTSSPQGAFDIENDLGVDGLRVDSTGSGATIRLRTYTGGYSPALYFDEGQTSPAKIYSSGNANDIRISTNGTDRMTFVAGGGVGVNTATPKSTFDVAGSLSLGAYGGVIAAPSNGLIVSGNLGIGTTSPLAKLDIAGTNNATVPLFQLSSVASYATTTEFIVNNNGSATLAGTLTQNSDQRLKTNIAGLDASSSLAAIDALTPVTFNWIDPSEGATPQLGFIAQQVQSVFPNLVSTTSATALTPDGTLGLNYIGLISPIVAAIQALYTDVETLQQTVAGFANNFVSAHITVTTLDATTGNFQELCVGSTCVTPQQFQAMVAAAGASQAAGNAAASPSDAATSSDEEATDTPPVIELNGDNPAIIQVGQTYEDLGAQITGPQQDLNLGIEASVDGGATTTIGAIEIDTSQPGTHTIEYVATDQNGLEGTATRTVDVIAPAASTQSPAATSTAPTSDSSSDPATSTEATTTTEATSTTQ